MAELKQHTDKTDAREALISAGIALFTQKSFEAVSTRELAEVAGVNLGAIQYHFGIEGQTVRCLSMSVMEQSRGCRGSGPNAQEIRSPHHAACVLCDFIFHFLRDLLFPSGPQACRVMFREILVEREDSREVTDAVVNAVVDDFIAPDNAYLLAVLQKLNPMLESG